MNCIQRLAALCAFAMATALAPAAASEPANVKASLERDAVCTKCHDETDAKPILSIYQSRHGVKADERTPTCQSCHGESDRHVKGDGSGKRAKPDVSFAARGGSAAHEQSQACLNCHREARRLHWSGSAHERDDMSCSTCHTLHAPRDRMVDRTTQAQVCFTCHKEQRAQVHRISTHPIDAGKVACGDCHNPHGSSGPKLLVGNTVNEVCFTCHAEKRGPFLWEHQPAADDCTNCHTPHGSNTAPLLKARLPFLCEECHQDHGSSLKSIASIAGGPGAPAGNAATPAATFGKYLTVQGNGRMCLNCHVMVHGSNTPNGAKFNR